MIRLFLTISSGALAILLSSCGCCTSDVEAPPLRPLPKFKEIPTPEVQVEHTK